MRLAFVLIAALSGGCLPVTAQWCFTIVDASDLRPIPGAFVICGIVSPTQALLEIAFMGLLSLDGQAHVVSCTGVNGVPGVNTQVYLAKSFTVPATGYYGLFYSPLDFGATGSTIPNSEAFTITCNLPPQTAISFVGGGYELDVGN